MMTEDLPSILLVEDDDDERFLAERALKKAGIHTIKHIPDGLQAKDYLEEQAKLSEDSRSLPDVVLMDLKLPGMDGHQVLEWMDGQPEFANALRYVLSSSGNPKDREKAAKTSIAGYFVKPLTLQNIDEFKKAFKERSK